MARFSTQRETPSAYWEVIREAMSYLYGDRPGTRTHTSHPTDNEIDMAQVDRVSAQIVDAIQKDNIVIKWDDPLMTRRSAYGSARLKDRTILLSSFRDNIKYIGTKYPLLKHKTRLLLHEWTHIFLDHSYIEKRRNQEELEAEMVAYLVSKHFGVDIFWTAVAYLTASRYYRRNHQLYEAARNSEFLVISTADKLIRLVEEAQHGETRLVASAGSTEIQNDTQT